MTKKHFEMVARIIRLHGSCWETRRDLAEAFAEEFEAENKNFCEERFFQACDCAADEGEI